MQNRKKRILPLIITILIMAFIFLQSALPADLSKEESNMIVLALIEYLHVDAENLSFAVRKGAHFTEYLVLGLSLFATVREYCPRSSRETERGLTETAPQIRGGQLLRTAMSAWVLGSLYAFTDEVHQAFVPGRSCEIRDMLIDSCGVAAGVLIMAAIRSRRTKT